MFFLELINNILKIVIVGAFFVVIGLLIKLAYITADNYTLYGFKCDTMEVPPAYDRRDFGFYSDSDKIQYGGKYYKMRDGETCEMLYKEIDPDGDG